MNKAHTYSVVARDPDSGDLGVAVQSHWFNVGRIVPWARAGIGAVATQSMVEISYGPKGLDLLAEGLSAQDALTRLLADDGEREIRQVAIVDGSGRVAAHTGSRCIADASHLSGDGWSVQANIMRSPAVVPAMAEAFQSSSGSLEDRLVATLVAAERAGGDLRGSQSAAVLVVSAGTVEPKVDLRVEDHPDPIGELVRLAGVAKAYQHMERGDEALARGDLDTARDAYSAAADQSDNPEVLFWQGLGMVEGGEMRRGVASLRVALDQNADLGVLLQRLPDAGLLEASRATELRSRLDLE